MCRPSVHQKKNEKDLNNGKLKNLGDDELRVTKSNLVLTGNLQLRMIFCKLELT
jgi:hypothetical protein